MKITNKGEKIMRRLMDLHIHTNFSDGILPPKEIIDRAAQNKVSVISITDHDSIDAYSEELFEYAKSKNVEFIPEIDVPAHMTGSFTLARLKFGDEFVNKFA